MNLVSILVVMALQLVNMFLAVRLYIKVKELFAVREKERERSVEIYSPEAQRNQENGWLAQQQRWEAENEERIRNQEEAHRRRDNKNKRRKTRRRDGHRV